MGDTPADLIFEELCAASFGDQPLGRSILGDDRRPRDHARDLPRGASSNSAARPYRGRERQGRSRAIGGARRSAPGRHRRRRSGHASPREFTGGVRNGRSPVEQAHMPSVSSACRRADDYFAARLFAGNWAAVHPRACSRRSARSAALRIRSAHRHPFTDTGLFYVQPRPRRVKPLPPRIDRASSRAAASTRSPSRARAGPARAEAGLLMALESRAGRRLHGAAARGLRPIGRRPRKWSSSCRGDARRRKGGWLEDALRAARRPPPSASPPSAAA